MKPIHITIPLGECDIELFKDLVYKKNAEDLVWGIDSDTEGVTVIVTFTKEEEI